MPKTRTTYRREEVDEFEGRLRRFSESLAHRERRMLREIIAAALDDMDDTQGYATMTDDQLFAALRQLLTGTTAE
jgi:predicted DNA-binding protein